MTENGSHGRDGDDGRKKRPRTIEPQDIVPLLDRLPPHAYEAEMSVLGSMLFDPQVTGDVIQVLRDGENFFAEANRVVFDAMVELYDKYNALDVVQLTQLLTDRGDLERIGGMEHLLEIAESVPSAANAMRYAKIVKDKSVQRRLIEAAGEILVEAHHGGESVRDCLEEAEKKIYKIANQAETTQAESMRDLVVEVIQAIEQSDGRLVTGVPTGYPDLDEMTHGLQPGDMIVLAARPSMGKTALALNLAEQMAMQGYPTGVFSLEMSKEALVQRLLSSRSGVDSHKIRRGMLSSEEWAKLQTACGELYEAPIMIDDTPGLSMLQMRAKARRMASKHDIRALVIDYLQLMTSGRRAESRQVEISEISRGVKAMARELRVPVICLSQLNRAAEQREGHKPRMSDLRESGSIEQDADIVSLLHREEYYYQADPDWKLHNPEKVGLTELIICKQRNGPTGNVRLMWNGATTRFHSWTNMEAPGGFHDIHTEPVDAGPRSAFSAKPASGPVSGFRDGGGPPAGFVDGIPT